MYSYDPARIRQNTVDRMRFELGDTAVDMEAVSSPLCNEEYAAVIQQYPTWEQARLACLRAIVMKLAYEVDTNINGLSYALSQRFPRWKAMLDEAEKKQAAAASLVQIAAYHNLHTQPYFYHDLHANPRK